MFVPPRAFDWGIVQETATLPNVSLQIVGQGNDRRSVKGAGAFTDVLEEWLGLTLMAPIRFLPSPNLHSDELRVFFPPLEKRLACNASAWLARTPCSAHPSISRAICSNESGLSPLAAAKRHTPSK
jgi:hypothetical protein